MTIPLNASNAMKGTGTGAEIAATWNVTHDWRLSGSYSLMELNLYGGAAADKSFYEGNTPTDEFQLHSYYNLTRNVELNASGYYVDPLATGSIPAYFRLDLGITWKPTDNISISLVGQNLLQAHHLEFSSVQQGTQATQIPRTIYGQVEMKF
jgi:iron complex outermembrane receptor protein